MATSSRIRLIVGLGNPGAAYVYSRHNLGFLTVDALASDFNVNYWKQESGCSVASLCILNQELLLAKPNDFMNTSGGPVSKLMRAKNIAPSELLVIHDELDLREGVVEVKDGGGLNAHNGLRSLANKLGTRDFKRVRIGIGRPPGKMDVSTFVLRSTKGEQRELLLFAAKLAAATTVDLVQNQQS